MNEIKINLDILIKENLSISGYCLLLSLLKSPSILDNIVLDPDLFDVLEERGYIKQDENSKWILRNKALKLFQNSEPSDINMKWQLFKSVFPIKDNKRRLHDQQEACKEKFNKLINNNPEEFDKIMLGLTNELEARRISGVKREFFPAPKAMSVWLNQKHYLTYQDKIEDKEEQGTNEISI